MAELLDRGADLHRYRDEATEDVVTRPGEGVGITFAEWAKAVLNNGLGRYPDASRSSAGTRYHQNQGSLVGTWASSFKIPSRFGLLGS